MTSVARIALVVPLLALPATALADAPTQCHVVDVQFTTASSSQPIGDRPQVVVWLETAAGEYKHTLYITQQTGSFGLGNRPGRFDFNSGPMWPYGRRVTTFPVWAHKHGISFDAVEYQNSPPDPETCWTPQNTQLDPAFSACGENNLSHPFDQSSLEKHFCQPLMQGDPKWQQAVDAVTCATNAYTDKGQFSATRKSDYPPRVDVVRDAKDSPSVDMYKAVNVFDAVSQATPPVGTPTQVTWPIPSDLPIGDYVMWVEVSKEFDFNATYNETSYPSPPATGPQSIYWAGYGLPARGQPSVVYAVPFTIGATETMAAATSYMGYGDPDGQDGAVRPPDATITTDTPGTGASRLQLVSDNGMYRVRVDARPEFDFSPPGLPDSLAPMTIASSSVALRFVAPGDDGQVGKVSGYDIKIRANSEMTPDNFESSIPVSAIVTPADPGQLQTFELDGLLPETDYWIGVRAYDKCHNTSDLAIVKVTTADRQVGEVDACFVATAAYGSLMANDVELLRHFRDTLLRSTTLGELAVETYYTFGPAVAGVVGESELLRASARDVLAPLVRWVRGLAF